MVNLKNGFKCGPTNSQTMLTEWKPVLLEAINDVVPTMKGKSSIFKNFGQIISLYGLFKRLLKSFLTDFFSALPHGVPADDRERRDLSFDRYNRENPCIGMKQIITGFSKWSDRYISKCSGQKNHSYQSKRMSKWGGIMNTGRG